jgi:Uma2 family endonuclease
MSIATTITAEQLLEMPRDGLRRELVQGELRTMPPAGSEHGATVVGLTWRVAQHAQHDDLGTVFGAETGFLLARNPDTVRAADCSFVRKERIRRTGIPRTFYPGAPDLAIEVVSPGDTVNEVDDKVHDWIVYGTTLVWVVNPRTRTVTAHGNDGTVRVLKDADVLEAPELLPGFRCLVRDIFVGP